MKGRLGRQGVGFEACRKGKVGVEAIAGRGKGGGGGGEETHVTCPRVRVPVLSNSTRSSCAAV